MGVVGRARSVPAEGVEDLEGDNGESFEDDSLRTRLGHTQANEKTTVETEAQITPCGGETNSSFSQKPVVRKVLCRQQCCCFSPQLHR